MEKYPKIWLSSPHMGEMEQVFIKEAFETNWVAPIGPHINFFEKELAELTGVNSVAALSSGTAAIHLALILLGVKPGDEVICQSFTFIASANPILYVGGIPVFVDSEPMTGNMDPVLLEKAIMDGIKRGKKAKAIIPVHLYGMPAEMDTILEIAGRYEIPVLEDAAEGLGSTYKNKALGSFGVLSSLSFNGNKIITTSGGGALISQDKSLIDKARFLATQARDDAPHYEHSEMGFNYRLSNILAGIGRGQLLVLEERIKRRREIFEFYRKSLEEIPNIQFLSEPEGSFSNRWLTTILIQSKNPNEPDREQLRLALLERNIESRPLWKPMHLQPLFSNSRMFSNGVSEEFFQKGLCLPSGSNLTEEDLSRVVDRVKEAFHLS